MELFETEGLKLPSTAIFLCRQRAARGVLTAECWQRSLTV
jgi:hypothetical protein